MLPALFSRAGVTTAGRLKSEAAVARQQPLPHQLLQQPSHCQAVRCGNMMVFEQRAQRMGPAGLRRKKIEQSLSVGLPGLSVTA
jgi:hypothetical protein